MSHAEVRRFFKERQRAHERERQADLPYDPEPKFLYPATCPSCDGDNKHCIWCKPMTAICAARMPLQDMTIR